MTDAPADTLAAALARHQIALDADAAARLDRYCQLLWQWNEKLNLTRHTDYERFVARDLVDTLAFAQFLPRRERVLDVGTGGGVPGVPLAIVRGDLRIALSESVGKKSRAVQAIVAELGLPINVHPTRAEVVLRQKKFDTLVIRAVAPLRKLLTWFAPHWDDFGRLLVLKGPAWVAERGEARHFGLLHGLALRKLLQYPLPGTENDSVLLQVCPEERLEKYPAHAAADDAEK